MRIHEGKIDRFEELSQEFIKIARLEDGKTLQYDWFFNEDKTECVVHEKYINSDAVLEHIANLGENLMGELRTLCEFSPLIICGTPSDQLTKIMGGLDNKVYHYFKGL